MEKHLDKSEKTIRISIILSSPGPLLTGISVVLSQSSTQLADFIRRTAELVAMIVSWLVYRKIHGEEQMASQDKKRLEGMSQSVMGIALIASGIMMTLIALMQVNNYQPAETAFLGIFIAISGFFVNLAFWFQYYKLNQEHQDVVTRNQERLYLAKSIVDFFVTIALLTVTFFPEAQTTVYFDLGGSFIVALYLVWSGTKLLIRSRNQTKS